MPGSNELNNGEREEAIHPVVSSAYLFCFKPLFPHPIIPVYLASQLLKDESPYFAIMASSLLIVCAFGTALNYS